MTKAKKDKKPAKNRSSYKISKEDYLRLKRYYSDELKRKDSIIEQLKEQNKLLIQTALKQSKKNMELSTCFPVQNVKNFPPVCNWWLKAK